MKEGGGGKRRKQGEGVSGSDPGHHYLAWLLPVSQGHHFPTCKAPSSCKPTSGRSGGAWVAHWPGPQGSGCYVFLDVNSMVY